MVEEDAEIAEDRALDEAGSPEGDGDFDASLPIAERGDEPAVDGREKAREAPALRGPAAHEPSALEKAIDEISHGTLLP